MRKKSLIINADDFGRSAEVNAAITRCVEAGTVTSTTVMVNMSTAAGISNLTTRTGFSIGLHVNLTEGRPTLPASEVPSLVDENGEFLPYGPFYKRAMTGRFNRDEIRKEITNQINILQQMAGRVDHMDSHEHIHLFPPVIRAMLKTAHDHGIRRIRTPERVHVSTDPAETSGQMNTLRHLLRNPKALAGLVLKADQSRLVRRAGFARPDYALTPQPALSLGDLEHCLSEWETLCSRMPAGRAELNCHPGHYQGETELFTDPRFKAGLDRHQITLCNFNDL